MSGADPSRRERLAPTSLCPQRPLQNGALLAPVRLGTGGREKLTKLRARPAGYPGGNALEVQVLARSQTQLLQEVVRLGNQLDQVRKLAQQLGKKHPATKAAYGQYVNDMIKHNPPQKPLTYQQAVG